MAQLTHRSTLLAGLLLAIAALDACCDCEEDEQRPPSLGGEAPPSGIACTRLVNEGVELADDRLLFDGGPADCAADGMACPLQQTEELQAAAECQPGQPVQAVCQQQVWQLMCVALSDDSPDAGATGAAGAAGGG